VASSLDRRLGRIRIKEIALPEPVLYQRGASIREVIAGLSEKRRSGAIICEGRRIAGIFTERDILTRLTDPGADLDAPIETVMTPSPKTLRPDDLLTRGIRMMTEEGYRQIPLVNDEGLGVGLLTARRVLMFIADHYPAEVLNLPPRLHQKAMRAEGA
jgi:CBS domain-containing protein